MNCKLHATLNLCWLVSSLHWSFTLQTQQLHMNVGQSVFSSNMSDLFLEENFTLKNSFEFVLTWFSVILDLINKYICFKIVYLLSTLRRSIIISVALRICKTINKCQQYLETHFHIPQYLICHVRTQQNTCLQWCTHFSEEGKLGRLQYYYDLFYMCKFFLKEPRNSIMRLIKLFCF